MEFKKVFVLELKVVIFSRHSEIKPDYYSDFLSCILNPVEVAISRGMPKPKILQIGPKGLPIRIFTIFWIERNLSGTHFWNSAIFSRITFIFFPLLFWHQN